MGNRNELLRALEEAQRTRAKMEDGILEMTCGEASCSVNVPENGQLSIAYSFPL